LCLNVGIKFIDKICLGLSVIRLLNIGVALKGGVI
jgi:hypothetical protein